MCNFYMMYYTTNDGVIPDSCVDTQYPELVKLLPLDADVPLPPNPLLEQHALGLDLSTARGVTGLPPFKTSVENVDTTRWILNKKGNLQGIDGRHWLL